MALPAEYTLKSCNGALRICTACERLCTDGGSAFVSAEMWQPFCNLKSKLPDFIFCNLRKVEFGNEISELAFSDQ